MSVKLIDNEAFYGYRVRRTVNGKLYQEYYSLKKGGKRMAKTANQAVLKEAEARDETLHQAQLKSKQKRKAELCFRPDGSVKGISYLVKTEKSGTRTPIFQIGIASERDNRIICTSFSINAHGLDAAWQQAVDAYAEHKRIRKGTQLYRQIFAAKPKVKVPAKSRAVAAKSKSRGKTAAGRAATKKRGRRKSA